MSSLMENINIISINVISLISYKHRLRNLFSCGSPTSFQLRISTVRLVSHEIFDRYWIQLASDYRGMCMYHKWTINIFHTWPSDASLYHVTIALIKSHHICHLKQIRKEYIFYIPIGIGVWERFGWGGGRRG